MATKKVNILLGQSNAEGVGLKSGLPARLLGPQADTYVWNRVAAAVQQLDESTGNNLSFPLGGPYYTHGTELTLCEAVVADLGECYLYKYAISATSLGPGSTLWWHPNGLPLANNMFNYFKTDFAAYVAAMTALGHTVDVDSVVWYQGEADVTYEGLDEAYLANLKYLIRKVRAFLEPYTTAVLVPWVTCIIADSIVAPGYGYLRNPARVVRAAQYRAGWSDPAYRVLDTNRFEHSDLAHLTSQGYQDCGTAIWVARNLPNNNS